jgi:exopolyphosphatase/guanosine-5'-triphosphate,3'-diphosphate pyrophosphatase
MRLAVVDIGSNSTRLFLCEGIGAQGPFGERQSRITGLRRGAAPDGSIAGEAIERLADALADYAGQIDDFAPERTVAIGTSAVRDAPNRTSVAAVVGGSLDVELKVISGEVEADLSYRGARLSSPAGPAVVVDIGGGSTEVVAGEGPRRHGAVSLQRGAVRCTETFLASDPPRREEIDRLRAALSAAMAEATAVAGGPMELLIGVAGTFTSLAAIDIGRYDPVLVHGHRLTRTTLGEITDRLGEVALAERRQIPGLHPGRAPYIVAGAWIAVAAADALDAKVVQVSERDLLDGVALAVMDPREPALL